MKISRVHVLVVVLLALHLTAGADAARLFKKKTRTLKIEFFHCTGLETGEAVDVQCNNGEWQSVPLWREGQDTKKTTFQVTSETGRYFDCRATKNGVTLGTAGFSNYEESIVASYAHFNDFEDDLAMTCRVNILVAGDSLSKVAKEERLFARVTYVNVKDARPEQLREFKWLGLGAGYVTKHKHERRPLKVGSIFDLGSFARIKRAASIWATAGKSNRLADDYVIEWGSPHQFYPKMLESVPLGTVKKHKPNRRAFTMPKDGRITMKMDEKWEFYDVGLSRKHDVTGFFVNVELYKGTAATRQ